MPPDADLRAPGAETRASPVSGFIDRVYDRRITGWAWSKAEPDAILEVEISLDGTPIATARADRLRQDLLRRRYGDGRHGFDVRLGEPLPEDARTRLSAIAILGDGTRIALRNRAAEATTRSPGPEAVVASVPEALRTWLDDFQAVQRQLESALTSAVRDLREAAPRVEADAGALGEALTQLRAAQDELARQVATIEVVQARVDGALARIDGAGVPGDGGERWLRRAVWLLALLSGGSLILGVTSLLR